MIAYSPAGNGAFDTNAVNNIRYAWNAGLGTEVFMTPQPKSYKKGGQQLQEVYNGLKAGKIDVKRVWVQVTSPVNWGANAQANIAFLNDIVKAAKTYGLTIGYYTSQYDWAQITKSAPVQGTTQLWYWNVNGAGPGGETPANFNDFRAFGGFTKPTAKQFGQVENVCGFVVNRDIYSLTNLATFTGKKNGEIVVGDVF
ncbi:hypothetical protein OESDEN_09140 [Oesophagostomum dentatum]|uniref:Glycosyl hydrolase family 25 n=1 Tax=Oesophagostomum dentatum TaxID=61180 RepID=A0A0B1T5D8_OESDE|nr:hypothetical protein OESDEN_09140 [Oesophagostomum dentatum]